MIPILIIYSNLSLLNILSSLRHWHRPFAREGNDTSDFVCKAFDSEEDGIGIVPLVEIEEGEGDDAEQWTMDHVSRMGKRCSDYFDGISQEHD